MPLTGAKNDWDDNGFSSLVTLHGTLHFDVIAVVRGYEIRADQEKYDLVSIDALINRLIDCLSCPNASIVPRFYDALVLEHRELCFKLVAECFIGVRVGEE